MENDKRRKAEMVLGGKEKKGEKSDLAKWKAVRPSNFLGAQDLAAQGNADMAVFHAVPKGDEPRPRSGGGFDSFQSSHSFHSFGYDPPRLSQFHFAL